MNNITSDASEIEDNSVEEAQTIPNLGLTKEQYQQLLVLLQNSQIQSAQPSSNQISHHHSINQISSDRTVNASSSGIDTCSNLDTKSVFPCWIVDSCATDHISSSLSFFNSYRSIPPIPIRLPNGSHVTATLAGTIVFSQSFYLSDVLYIPGFNFNIISITKLTSSLNCCLKFTDRVCKIQEPHTLRRIGSAEVRSGLYVLQNPALLQNTVNLTVVVPVVTSTHNWHCRLGHISPEKLYILHKSFPYISISKCTPDCTVCPLAKQRKLPFPISCCKTSAPFELLHVDIWGPNSVASINGYKYFVTIVDDFTRHTWIFFMKAKSETGSCLISFITMAETQFNCKVKFVRSDNGPEFNLVSFYNSKGIIHQKSCVETPQQNGVVERKHQQILNITRALMFQSNLPTDFWHFALAHAVFLMNRLPSKALNNQIPFEILHGRKPDLQFLRVFGCQCFASTLSHNRRKLDPRARRCVYLGHRSGVKGFLVYDLATHEVIVSRNVIFHEKCFPFKTACISSDTSNFVIPAAHNGLDSTDITSYFPYTSHSAPPPSSHAPPSPLPNLSQSPTAATHNSASASPPDTSPIPDFPVRRSQRQRKTPSYLQDFHCALSSSTVMDQDSTKSILYPISQYVSYSHLSPSYRNLVLSLSSILEPKTFNQAIKFEEWRQAMAAELTALEQNNTWALTKLPPDKKAIECKWVYKVEYHADGSIGRHKA